jgi:hypothetical protein
MRIYFICCCIHFYNRLIYLQPLCIAWLCLSQAIVLPVNHSKTVPAEEEAETSEEEDKAAKYAELRLIELREMSLGDGGPKKAGW